MNALMLRRHAMMRASEATPPTEYYLAATAETHIQLPFKFSDTPIIEADCYTSQWSGGGTYQGVLCATGNYQPGLYRKGVPQYRFQPFLGLQTEDTTWKRYVIDGVNSKLTVIPVSGEPIEHTTSSISSTTNTLRVLLRPTDMYKRLKVTIGGNVAYDFVATKDSDETPCFEDVLTGTYYYDVNGTAVLTLPPQ